MVYSAFKVGRAVSPTEKRRAPRQDVSCKGLIHDGQGSIIAPCFMMNVSASGAKLVIEAGINVPDWFFLALARNAGVRRECEVVWRTATSIGVRFVASPH
jgi:hypothetical protein